MRKYMKIPTLIHRYTQMLISYKYNSQDLIWHTVSI